MVTFILTMVTCDEYDVHIRHGVSFAGVAGMSVVVATLNYKQAGRDPWHLRECG